MSTRRLAIGLATLSLSGAAVPVAAPASESRIPRDRFITTCNFVKAANHQIRAVIFVSPSDRSGYLHWAKLLGKRRASIWECKTSSPCPGGQIDSGDIGAKLYGVGHTETGGPFRCQVLRTGVRCTVRATGTGFLINNHRAVRVA
jgi:hypothetical protein